MKLPGTKSIKPGGPKVAQPARTQPAHARPLPLSARGVAQARTAQFNTGPKIAAPPVYRPDAKKIVQPKLMVHSHAPKFAGALGQTARTIQRAEENPYKKEYTSGAMKKTSDRTSARNSPYGVKAPRSARLQARGGGGVRPNYTPPKDSAGNLIWDGGRSGLSWSATITAAMAGTAAGGCQIGGPLCTGAANAIDHITDFADMQSSITQYLICDGAHHWKACYKDDAISVYNNGDDPSNMQWSCTQCNSQKSGARGRYENQPQWVEQCPGGACTYAPWGEMM
jgi:hypothetical protein